MANGRRILTGLIGGLVSLPVALIIAYYSADYIYVHFIFEGELRDFAPGDALGVFMLTGLIFSIFFVITMILCGKYLWTKRAVRVVGEPEN